MRNEEVLVFWKSDNNNTNNNNNVRSGSKNISIRLKLMVLMMMCFVETRYYRQSVFTLSRHSIVSDIKFYGEYPQRSPAVTEDINQPIN